MSTIAINSISQAEPVVSPATVLIHFTVLGILPDKVQVYAAGQSGGLAILKDEVDMTPPTIEYTSSLVLAGGTAFTIQLCPRTTTDGVPDDKIDEQFFEAFCTQIVFTTKAPASSAPAPLRAPIINSIAPNQATLHADADILVRWSAADECDNYHFMWTDAFPPPSTEAGWNAVELTAPKSHGLDFKIPKTAAGRTYTFKVQGCKTFNIGPDSCSPFGPESAIQMPKNTRSVREFLRLSNVLLNPGIRSLGAPAFSAGFRAMMKL